MEICGLSERHGVDHGGYRYSISDVIREIKMLSAVLRNSRRSPTCKVLFGIVVLFIFYRASSVFVNPKTKYTNTRLDYIDRETGITIQPTVLRWDGGNWIRWSNFCSDRDTDNYILADFHSPAGDISFYVHDAQHDSYTSRKINTKHTYEASDLHLMYRHLLEDESMGLVDIGSHVGLYSIIAAQLGRQIIAVDTLHMNIHAWCHSIKKHRFVDQVKQLYTIMSSAHRLMTFQTEKNHVGGTTVHIAEDQEALVSIHDRNYAHSATLDDLIPIMSFRKVFLKLDIEKHEFEVILGGEKFFRVLDVPYVLMEWVHHVNGPNRQNIINFMTKLGYKGYSTFPEAEVDFRHRDHLYNILWKK